MFENYVVNRNATKDLLLKKGFKDVGMTYKRSTYLYKKYISVVVNIAKDLGAVSIEVINDKGETYAAFYNEYGRDEVKDEVVGNLEKCLEVLIKDEILFKKERVVAGNTSKKSKVLKTINVKKLNKTAIIPARGSDNAAGYDLYSNNKDTIEIAPGGMVKIGTGLSFELPAGTFGAIFARSGMATKQGCRPANCVGVCDSDYRGEYIVPLYNDSDEVQTIEPNTRIAQLVLLPYIPMVFSEVDELSSTERGTCGFGSSGVK